MESRVKVLGHAIHPILIPFPLGLLPTGVIFDVVHLMTNNPAFATVAFWMMAAGTAGGILAAIFGLIDWLAIPRGTRAWRVGLWHGGGNDLAMVLFAISCYLRYQTERIPTTEALALSFAGLAILVVTGWLGGELVERLGVSVDDGAHLDAPSSLSGPVHAGGRRSPGAA